MPKQTSTIADTLRQAQTLKRGVRLAASQPPNNHGDVLSPTPFTSKDYDRTSGVPTESYATAIANIESESKSETCTRHGLLRPCFKTGPTDMDPGAAYHRTVYMRKGECPSHCRHLPRGIYRRLGTIRYIHVLL